MELLSLILILIVFGLIVGWPCSYIRASWLRIPLAFVLAAIPGVAWCEFLRWRRERDQA